MFSGQTVNKPYVSGPTKHCKEPKGTRDRFAIRVRVRAAYLSSVIVAMSLEAK